MRFWVGPWEWQTVGGQSCWGAPAGVNASLDLRSSPQCAVPVTPQGFGFFTTANATSLGSDYTNLGTDPDVVLSGAQKASWQSRFGLPNVLAANTLRDTLWETITIQSDPTGLDRVAPLVPNINKRYEVWLGGVLIGSKAFRRADDEATPVIDLLQRIYRSIRQDVLNGVSLPKFHLKFLGGLARKFGVDYHNFLPGDLPDEGDLPPETTITENFNTADSTTLGPNLSWTEYKEGSVSDRFQVVSNQCFTTHLDADNASSARADSDLSSVDHYAQVTLVVLGSGSFNKQAGPAARFSSSAQTHYHVRVLQINDNCQLCKVVAGTLSTISGGTVITVGAFPVKITCDGSSIRSQYNGVDQETVSDTSITTGTRCGLFGYASASEAGDTIVDDFTASDIRPNPTWGETVVAPNRTFTPNVCLPY